MKYEIFELIKPKNLEVVTPMMGYSETKEREVLEKLEDGYTNYSSFEEALEHIQTLKGIGDFLKGKRLTILPIIEISWIEDNE